MAGPPAIDVKELKAFRKNLAKVKPDSPEWQREFAQINKRAGDAIASEAGSRLAGRGPRGARAATGVKGSASAAGVRVRVVSTGAAPFVMAEVFGAKRRSGWYAAARYGQSSGRQHPLWVGAAWKPGDPGEGPGVGPYGLGPAVHDQMDRVVKEWADAVEDLMARFAGR